MVDIVYVITNAAMPGLVKIGVTNGDVATRLKQLDTTGMPLPFECFYAAEVKDCAAVEKAIHKAFGDHRVRQSREFFKLSPDKPKAIIELHASRTSRRDSSRSRSSTIRKQSRRRRSEEPSSNFHR